MDKEVRAACKAIRNITEEMVALREAMLHSDSNILMNDANIQSEYQSLMIRGMGVMLGVTEMLLGRDREEWGE